MLLTSRRGPAALGWASLILGGPAHKSEVSSQVGSGGRLILAGVHSRGWGLASCGLIENSLGCHGWDTLARQQESLLTRQDSLCLFFS